MGCTASTEKLENYVIAPLRIELADAIEWNKKMLADAAKKEQKQNDQINLLRFKIEVLIQMCGTEVKKSEILEKRIEALKWALLSQGWSEKNMNNMLATINNQKDSLTNDLKTKLELLSSFDISGTLQKMSKLMNTSADEIIIAFSDNDGKIAPVLSRSEFINVLKEAVGDHLDDIDIQIITLRFFDGTMVSIPEFLDFFISTAEVRRAKAATATVRACINKLQLDLITDEITENETRQSLFPSLSVYDTLAVDNALKKLLSLWSKVERTLKIAFEQQSPSNRFIDAQVFQDILIDVCGGEEVDDDLPDNTNRNKQSFRYKNSNSNNSLTVDDIQLIVERFEVRERIDYISFLQYFSERLHLSHSRGSLSVSSTPYRVSSEWAALRVDARLLANSTVFRSQAEPSLESPTDLAPPQKGNATPPKLAAKVTQHKKTAEKEHPPKPLSINNENKNQKDEKKDNNEEKSTAGATSTSTSRFNRRLSTRTPSKRLKSINEADEKDEKSNNDTLTNNNNTDNSNLTTISEENGGGGNTTTNSVATVPTALLAKYTAGPALFQKYLTARAEKCPEKGKFTESSLKSNLKEMVPNVKEIELVEFTENLKFENDLCSVIDVISTLEALKRLQQSSQSDPAAAPSKNSGGAGNKKKDEKGTQPDVIESELDSIASAYQNDKKGFKNILNTSASSLEKKSFSEVELKDFLIENIATVTSEEMVTFMGLLKPFIKKDRVTPANIIKVLDKVLAEDEKRIKLLKKTKGKSASGGGGGGACCSSKAAAKEAVHDPNSNNNSDKKENKAKKENKNDSFDDKESKNNLDKSFETVGNDLNESSSNYNNNISDYSAAPAPAPTESVRNKRAAMLAKDSLQLSSSTSFAFSEENNHSSSDISGVEDYKQQDQSLQELPPQEDQEVPPPQEEAPQKTNPTNNNNTSKFNAPKNLTFRTPRQSHNDSGERLTDDAMKAEFKENSRKLMSADSEVDEPFKNLK